MKIRKKDGVIGSFEAFCLCNYLIYTKMFLAMPRHLIEEAGPIAWAVPILVLIFSLLFFYILTNLLQRFEDLSFLEIIGELWGSSMQWIIGVLFAFLFLVITAYQLRIIGEFLLSTLLPQTPLSAVLFIMVATFVYLAYFGIENLARLAGLLFPWLLVAFVVTFLLAVGRGEFYNFSPWLGYGEWRLFVSTVNHIGIYKEILLLAFIAPLFRKHQTLRRTGFTSLIFVAFFFFFAMAIYIYVFPVHTGSELGFPLFQLTRLVYYGAFLQRIDPLFMFVWASISIVGMATGLYVSALSLAQGAKASDYRPFLFPLAVILLAIAFYHESSMEAVKNYRLFPAYIAIPFFGIPILAWLWALLFHRQRRQRQ
ncbi:GerAB/ArcD/ProY family transporter [Heliorestis acidaminivorans]|uniref:GerAB/ArcD/ProY family transporter n=1 Tax=Heliorestis acidaminivorans TaxID=553427 RepID=A0A6I0F222_9FIRM|nr:endospore germination permease [Heliorestis acidaminivorans]KAB2953368.1 GerAB/ArcD/ProY family transporter [Heliorestis acidaminivorans]